MASRVGALEVSGDAPLMTSEDAARVDPSWRRPAIAAGAMLVVYLAWQVTRLGGASHQVLIGDLAYLPLYGLVLATTLGAARRCRLTPRLARSWRLLTMGSGCSLAGNILQTYEEAFHHHLHYPSVADIAFLGFYAFFFAGFVGFARSARSGTRRVMFGLDVLTVALGGGAVLWYFIAGPSALAGGQSWPVVALAVAYPLGDLLLLVGAAATLLRPLTSSRRSLSVTTAGVGLYVSGDLIWSQVVLHGTYHGGDVVDTLWVAATVLFVIGAALQPVTRRGDVAAIPISAARRAGWVPYAALAASFTLLLVVHRHDQIFPQLSITLIAVAIALVVGARQLLAQRALADEQARSEELLSQLRHQAFHDALTGIANRALFNERLDHALARRAIPGRRQAVLMIDLDGFKAINDRFGHDAGDRLLITVADRIRTCVRRSDTAARLGGDEFVVLAEDLPDALSATMLAAHLLKTLEQPLSLGPRNVIPRASIGVAVTGTESVEPEVLLRSADKALYQAKNSGRGRVCVFQGTMKAIESTHV